MTNDARVPLAHMALPIFGLYPSLEAPLTTAGT